MSFLIQVFIDNILNILAFVWFMVCFKGYTYYASRRVADTPCLFSVLHMHRKEWMLRMLKRDMRMPDTTAIANLERSVAFFASTTILILAGLVTILGSTQQAIDVVADVPFVYKASRGEWELKILLLISLMVYAFFKFTWSLRQYGFVTIMIGGAPEPLEHISDQQIEAYASRISHMTSMAANNFNLGLRTYYFCMSVLSWFINPWLFMLMAMGVVIVLYRREFKSSTLKTLMMSVNED